MPEPASPRRASVWTEAALALALAAIVFAVYRGALAYFFAQDDFAGLARAGGLMPRLQGPWRWLSGQGYFDVMRALSGLDPRGYHLASLAALASTTLLAYCLYRRRTGIAAAWLGAAFYAAHPAHFTALYSVSGIGELLAPLFAVAAVLALDAPAPRRWLAMFGAPALFALSLGCKETTLLLPLVALARPRPPGRAGARADVRDPAWLAMVVVAVAYVATFLARDTFGVRSGLGERAAYALRFDGTLLANASTYLGWTTNALLATTRSFADAVDPAATPWALAAVAIAIGGLLSPPLRSRGWGFGVAWYAAMLVPVLPLANHTYHYYLVTPLVGAGACVAAAADSVLRRRAATRSARGERSRGGRGTGPARGPAGTGSPAHRGWLAATVFGLLGVAWAVNGALLVHKNETYPSTDPELRSDATVDRARIARNVRDDLAASALAPGTTVRFWSPASIQRETDAGHDAGIETYWERNVRNAMLDGLGVRVLFSNVTRVEFVRRFTPEPTPGPSPAPDPAPGSAPEHAPESAPESTRWAVYLPSGHLRVATTSELAAALQEFARSSRSPTSR